ncbi:unnamed protein product [Closterium sp. Naga37s-1]|nr:unnamed protein product [Closterium sp. Naga37s-1]
MFVTRPSSSLPLFAHPPPLFLPSSPPYPAMRQLLRTNLRVPAARNGAADPAGADDRGTTRGGSAAADGHGGCSHYDSADAFLEFYLFQVSTPLSSPSPRHPCDIDHNNVCTHCAQSSPLGLPASSPLRHPRPLPPSPFSPPPFPFFPPTACRVLQVREGIMPAYGMVLRKLDLPCDPHVLLPNLPFFSPPVPPFPPSHFAFSLVFPPVPHSAACLVPSLSAHLPPSFSTHNLISASAIFSYSPPSLPPPSVCAVSPDSHPCCSHLPPRLVFITSPLTRPL